MQGEDRDIKNMYTKKASARKCILYLKSYLYSHYTRENRGKEDGV